MAEYLFKLKKDGKCVGYMRLKESPRGLEWRYFDKNDSRESLLKHSIFDTAYPFVCEDKNGNDVFADDKVNQIGDGDSELFYEVVYHPETCQWFIENNEDSFDIEVGILSGNCEYIELIVEEEKDD